MKSKWLEWARTLQSMSQIGLTYANDPFDCARYTQLQKIAAEMMSAATEGQAADVLSLFKREEGYATPKVDVRAAVFRSGEILMVRENDDGRWSLPGGWADVAEPPSSVAQREVMEEAGYSTRATKLLAILDRDRSGHPPLPFHIYKIFLQCELLDERPQAPAECTEVGFFAEGHLPELSVSRVTEAQVTRMFRHLHDPQLPADFD